MPISLWRWAPGAWSVIPLEFKSRLAWPQMYILSPCFESARLELDCFLLWKQPLLLARLSQPHAPQSLAGEELGVTTWQRSFITKQPSLDSCLNSVCTPNWTEANCPICWQKPSSLTSKNPHFGGRAPRGAEGDGDRGPGRAHSLCLSSRLTSLWIQGSSPPSPQPSPPKHTRGPNPVWSGCATLHTACCGGPGIRGRLPEGPGHLGLGQQRAFSRSPGDNGIGAFHRAAGPPQGS